jgi:alpha-tubulin suppressor-like RCC1 family protein
VDEFTSVERVLALRDPLEVAVGDRFGCARPPDGSVRCWGASERGQAGPGPAVASVPRPVPLPRPVVAVFAGFRTACAITDDRRLLCWGELLGASRPDPVGVPLPGDPVTVAVGNTHLCAGLADGRIFCLGSNDRGQLGDGTTIDSLAPVEAVFE